MNSQATARWEHRLLVLATLGVVLFLLPGVHPQLGRNVALQASAAAMLVALVAAAPPWSYLRTVWPVVLLVLPALVATLVAVAPTRSLLGPFDRGGGLLSVLALAVVVAFVALRTLFSGRRLRWWFAGITLALLGYQMAQLIGVDPVDWTWLWPGRVAGVAGNPLYHGGVLALILPFLLEGALDGEEGRRDRLFLAVLTGLSLTGIILSHTRGPLLGAGAGMWILCLIRLVRNAQHRRAQVMMVVGLFGLLGAVGLWSNGVQAGLFDERTEPALGRLAHYEAAVEAIVDADAGELWLGNGLESVPLVVPEKRFAPRPGAEIGSFGYDHAHNLFYELLITRGLLGVIALCTVLAIAALRSVRQRDPFRDAASATLVAFIFEQLMSVGHVGSELLFALALGFVLAPQAPQKTPLPARRERALALGLPAILVVVSVGITAIAGLHATSGFATWCPVVTALIAAAALLWRRPSWVAIAGTLAGLVAVVIWAESAAPRRDLVRAAVLLRSGNEEASLQLVEHWLEPERLAALPPGGAYAAGSIAAELWTEWTEWHDASPDLTEDAWRTLDAAERLAPADPRPVLRGALLWNELLRRQSLANPGDWDMDPFTAAAETRLLAALQHYDRDADLHARLAEVRRQRGDLRQALGDQMRAVTLEPRQSSRVTELLQLWGEVQGEDAPDLAAARALGTALDPALRYIQPDFAAKDLLLSVLPALVAAIDDGLRGEAMDHPDRELRARLESARSRLAAGR